MNRFLVERTAHGIAQITLDSRLLEKRVLYFDSVVDEEKINQLIRAFIVLSDEKEKPITLVIDSPGGSIQAGLALIDVMNACPCIINTVVLGMGASMGAVIAAAGTKGNRYISKHSRLMIHEPLLQNGVSGTCTSIQATAKSILERKTLITQLLVEYTGKTSEEIEAATAFDNYMSAEEAKKFGLVDMILEETDLLDIIKGGN